MSLILESGANSQGGREQMVKSALDILIPALPGRLPKDDFKSAIRRTKKIVYDENHLMPQLA